ncbi:MAG: hypothetical protein ACRD51_15750, partial [Candidatus Acidiferrum sp.]
VRGRVAWIQRPRTVRQLFQVALELEAPGNTWGIAFPPPDWFAPEQTSQDPHAHEAAQETPRRISEPAEIHLPLTELEPAAPPAQDNLRIFPAPASTTDASLQLARHMSRLVADAKQQIQAAAREAAVQAVAAERRVSMEEWERKFSVAREQLAQQVSGAVENIQHESETRSRAAHAAAGEALQRELPRWIAPQLEELTRTLTQQISDRGAAERKEQTQQLASIVESLQAVQRETEASASRLRTQADQAEAQIANRAMESKRETGDATRQQEVAASAHREALNAAAQELQQQVAAAIAVGQASFQSRLAGEVEAAQARWQSALEATLTATQEKAAGDLGERARGVSSQMQEEADRRTAAARESLSASAAEAEQRASTLRETLEEQSQRLESALGRAAESTGRLENFSSRLEAAQSHALAGFETQIGDVLSLHRNELHRQSETLLEELNARIRGTFEENCQLALSKFDQQIDSMVQPHISRTEEAVHRLAGGRSLLDAALTLQQDRIRTSADEAFAESLAHFRENLGGIDQILQEAAQTVASRNLSEIESKVSDLKHQTVDDLMKSAEWYEKKAQTQIQNLTEKTFEQAENQFREKAGEVSGVFASELDHSSRSFVGHTQTQMEEVVRDAFEHARALFAEAAETTTAAFTDEIQRQARQELDGFGDETQRALGETRLQLDAARADLSQKVTSEQEIFLRQFQAGMIGAVENGVADANARVKAGLAPLLESWKSTVDAHGAEMRNIYSNISDQAADQHRGRLENISNQWMLATVASLDHQSREAVASIAASAEEKLRETCAQVFAGVGDALRERLQQIAASLTPPEPPKTRSTTAGGDR